MNEEGKARKRPCAWGTGYWTSYHDEREWRSADAIAPGDKDGVGYGISLAKPVTGENAQLLALDLDACRDPQTGVVDPWALAVIKHCANSYTEITPSGTGLRTIVVVSCKVVIPEPKFTPRGFEGVKKHGKTVECQVFGADTPGFVTISGNVLSEDTRELRRIADLHWWTGVFTRAPHEGRSKVELPKDLPIGVGEPPTMQEIQDAIDAAPDGKALQDCTWQELPQFAGGRDENGEHHDKSNSEAFFALERLVLRGARGHGKEALRFLLTECPRWEGNGLAEKYSRASWVERDLKKAATYEPTSYQPFDALDSPAVAVDPTGAAAADAGAQKTKDTLPWTRQTLQELLAFDPPPWAIKGYARRGQVGVIGAAPTVGKSTLLAAWMMSVLHGQDWCGHRVKGGSVLALVGENAHGFANSLAAYARYHEFDPVPPDRYLEIVDFRLPISGVPGQVALSKLVKTVTEERGHAPALVVIDTLSAHWAASEDSSEFMAPAFRSLVRIGQTWGCVVAVAHHLTKAGGSTVMPTLQDLRGSGALSGAIDFAVGLCAPEPDVVHVAALKTKRDQLPAPVKLTRVSVECGVDSDGDQLTAGVFLNQADTLTSEEERRTNAFAQDTDRVVEALRSMGTANRQDTVVKASGMHAARGRKCFAAAVKAGRIANTGTERKPNYTARETTAGSEFTPLTKAECPEFE